MDADGDVKIIQRYESAGDDVQKRFEARLKSADYGSARSQGPVVMLTTSAGKTRKQNPKNQARHATRSASS